MPYNEDISGAGGAGIALTDSWEDPVADLTALNAVTSPSLGETRYVISEDDLYIYNGASWKPSDPAIHDGGTY